MFNAKNNLDDNQEQQPADQPVSSQEQDFSEADIHTMPGKFLHAEKLPRKKGKISWPILGILAFVVLGGVIAVVVIFLGQQAASPAVNQPPVNQPVANTNANTNAEANQNQNVNQEFSSAITRDSRRLEDISNLRTALSLYYSTNNFYPPNLSALLGDYLTAVPVNPPPEKTEYAYQQNSEQNSYRLYFTLESGGALGPVKLSSGDYLAMPDRVLTTAEYERSANTNLNANQNQNVNGSTTLPVIPQNIVRPTLGLDSDGDQLTDIEENVYNTNSALADTDSDSYTDTAEILNFYDPTKVSGRLMDSGLIEVYQNTSFNYSLLYPKSWVARSLTADNREVIFTSSTGEFIEIIVQDNPLSLSAYNWYLNQNPGLDPTSISSIIIDGLPAIQTADSLTVYLAVGTKIYTLAYNIGTQNQMNFQTTYQLFLKSFMFITPAQ